jgi:hypothetical protein
MAKITQHEAIVRHLAARSGEWCMGYDLEKVEIGGRWIGTRGARSARDLALAGRFTVGGNVYFIERKTIGKYSAYRVVSSKKIAPKFDYIERNGVRVEVAHQLSADEVFASL